MKKLLLAALALFSSFLCLTTSGSAEGEKIMISSMQGSALIVRDGQEIAAAEGLSCQTNDILKTTPTCVLDITMNDQLGCRVLASSEVEIADAKEKLMRLKLGRGNVILNVNKLAKDVEFSVETPTAIAAVRGTQFWGRVEGAQFDSPVTTFAVREGSIDIFVLGAQKSFTLNQGEALDIPKDASVVPSIRPALAGELDAMAQASAIKTSA
jgi:hypothetical protein